MVCFKCFIAKLYKYCRKNKSQLDLSSVDFDGGHTFAIREGEELEYQGRKKRKPTNLLYLSDRQRVPLSISDSLAGSRHGFFNIEVQFEIVTGTLEHANIPVERLF
jgi:hypothetical protein